MRDQVKNAFNQLANSYEHHVDQTSLYNSQYERPAMLQQIPIDLTNRKGLDAGCAAGWYTEQLLARGADVVAIDVSPKMIEATKRRIGTKAEAFCLDLAGMLPFQKNNFDFIVSSLTLHYIEDWEPVFQEWNRVLKPGGSLLFSVHHPFTDIKLSQTQLYFEQEHLQDRWKKEEIEVDVEFYRRPLSMILNDTLKYFTLEQVIEPLPTATFKQQAPEAYEKLMKQPNFLILQATNKKAQN
ncbi:class I SAM-dependent methyltransferase [Halalkalibacter akibai]|uniref:Methylase n=1 Tax=Halalkalibacter akibai (strain ATCC 43226 / DSM 21942 / CIP 109018 / JCM 9157 / 1139) TaxID=1236973 RepID=W4QN38_HALA3|nr:class I SAM-dependent methyltransferase [Halalkalibacter akibai]GAE33068.1 methylase [Halalkalibacter akibai JCM 9157]